MSNRRISHSLTAAMTKEQQQYCLKVTEKIIALPISKFFMEKVDPKLDNCPDYYDHIKRPMWLQKVRELLSSGQYPNVERWKDDMNLIWKNAMSYNKPNEPIYIIADELHNVFKSMSDIIPNEVERWVMKMKKAQQQFTILLESRPDTAKRAKLRLKGPTSKTEAQ